MSASRIKYLKKLCRATTCTTPTSRTYRSTYTGNTPPSSPERNDSKLEEDREDSNYYSNTDNWSDDNKHDNNDSNSDSEENYSSDEDNNSNSNNTDSPSRFSRLSSPPPALRHCPISYKSLHSTVHGYKEKLRKEGYASNNVPKPRTNLSVRWQLE